MSTAVLTWREFPLSLNRPLSSVYQRVGERLALTLQVVWILA